MTCTTTKNLSLRWSNIRTIHIKSTMGKSHLIYNAFSHKYHSWQPSSPEMHNCGRGGFYIPETPTCDLFYQNIRKKKLRIKARRKAEDGSGTRRRTKRLMELKRKKDIKHI